MEPKAISWWTRGRFNCLGDTMTFLNRKCRRVEVYTTSVMSSRGSLGSSVADGAQFKTPSGTASRANTMFSTNNRQGCTGGRRERYKEVVEITATPTRRRG
jgi:hypothetical protein